MSFWTALHPGIILCSGPLSLPPPAIRQVECAGFFSQKPLLASSLKNGNSLLLFTISGCEIDRQELVLHTLHRKIRWGCFTDSPSLPLFLAGLPLSDLVTLHLMCEQFSMRFPALASALSRQEIASAIHQRKLLQDSDIPLSGKIAQQLEAL